MKKLIGLFASVAMLSSGVAFAHGQDKVKESQTQSQGATGGSGSQMGQSEQSGMTHELTGRVVKSDKSMVWVEHADAIVPLKIDKKTQFTDPSLKRAQDLKEGDEIRASFEVRKTDNVATSIGKSAGTGGSGTEVMSPDSSINQQPPSSLPSDKGTEQSSPDMGQGQNQNKSSGDY